MCAEKRIAEVTVRMSESLKHDLQDIAAHDDRTLSETIRILLESQLYGLKARRDAMCEQRSEGQTLRGIA